MRLDDLLFGDGVLSDKVKRRRRLVLEVVVAICVAYWARRFFW